MIISYQWLLNYLPVTIPVNDLSNILTSIGLEVEAIEPVEAVKGGLEGLIIGEILTCSKHPNADKLSVTTVTIGDTEILNIVCGAPNVAAGQKVVVATVGTTVHPLKGESFQIKKAKIRGEESAGMLCAEDEIGLGNSHAGIIVLPANAVIGIPAKEYYKIPQTDYAIHIGLTPNRSDANSHIGVAKDVCAYLSFHKGEKQEVVLPKVTIENTNTEAPIDVNILEPEACKRYAGLSINNVKIDASPEWLQQKLNTIGIRSINNIVDITNYVLNEYGQPLHAFDANAILGNKIKVQFLPNETPFEGLDKKIRKLKPTDIVISNENSAMALGGVFGGLNSGINDQTTNIFLESAYFDPMHIRKTSLYHDLRTDAAQHFEKGVDINQVIPALWRAAHLIMEIAGGTIASKTVDVFPQNLNATIVNVSYNYIRNLSGKDYSITDIHQILTALGFIIIENTIDYLVVSVPGNKPDVSQPADIVEEILRIDGLDNIIIPDRLNISLLKTPLSDRAIREKLSELLCGMGMQEIVTNSIINSKYYPERTDLVKMINSLSSELDVMRPSMTEGGLEVINYNCNRKSQDLCLFEFGNIYTLQQEKYIQYPRLAVWISGNTKSLNWNQKPEKGTIFYLKGIINNLLAYCGIDNTKSNFVETDEEIIWKWNTKIIAKAYPIKKERLDLFDIKQEVFYAELIWDNCIDAISKNKIKYKEVPKFPAVQRDLALILDVAITYEKVQEITEKLKISELQSYNLFDVFEHEKLGKGKKSFALNYIFQLQDRTLTDIEIEQLMRKLIDEYKNKLNALIRE